MAGKGQPGAVSFDIWSCKIRHCKWSDPGKSAWHSSR